MSARPAVEAYERDFALEELRHYLTSWRRWERAWKPKLGYPSAWPMASIPSKAAVSCGNMDDALEEPYRYEEAIEGHILKAIHAVVESLPANKRAAVRLIYLREEPGKAVFRSGRMTLEEATRLCNEAEIEMIPKLRARGVLLGGN